MKKRFSLEETQCWKGLLALFIVLDYLWIQHNMISLALFHESAVILVSIYFFFSGYGVCINFMKRSDYMGLGFWKKRVIYLILPMIIADLFMFLWNCLCGMEIDNMIIVNYLIGKTLFNEQTWYIRELLICYMIFNIMIKKFLHPAKIIVGCITCVTLMNIVLFISGYGYHWYGSNYGFIIGICFAYSGGILKKRMIEEIPLSRLTVIVFIMTVLLSIIYKIFGRDIAWNILLVRNAMTLMATVFFICTTSICTIESKGFDKISKVSMEIFLSHMLVIEVSMKLMIEKYPIALVAFVLITTIVLSHLFHKCLEFMRNIV